MKRKAVSIIMHTLLLIGMFTLAFNIRPVRAYETIRINADGSINPPTAPIETDDYVTYYLTYVINGEIVVERSNIIIDGKNLYPVQGQGISGSKGISLFSVSNVTIRGIDMISGYDYCVYLYYSSGCNVSGDISIAGSNWAGVYLYYCSGNNSISGNDINSNRNGIYLYHSSNCGISGNKIRGSQYGIRLDHSSGSSISGNNFISNFERVFVTPDYADSWDRGYPSGGNYWSDYTGVDLYSGPHQNLTGSDGIGDTPYAIDENNQDNYPLMTPIPRIPWDITGPTQWISDDECNIGDLAQEALLFGSITCDGRYDRRADITGPSYLVTDGKIDIRDVFLVAKHFGETYYT